MATPRKGTAAANKSLSIAQDYKKSVFQHIVLERRASGRYNLLSPKDTNIVGSYVKLPLALRFIELIKKGNGMEEILNAHSRAVEVATFRYVLNLLDRLPVTEVIETLHVQIGDDNVQSETSNNA